MNHKHGDHAHDDVNASVRPPGLGMRFYIRTDTGP